ncbi:MAG: ANTAR domain-containing protein [Pseudomonadota bacterium]
MSETARSNELAKATNSVLLIYYNTARRDTILDGLGADASVESMLWRSVPDMVELVKSTQPTLLIWDVEQQEIGWEAVAAISSSAPLPIVVFSSGFDAEDAKRALQAGVSVYVADDLQSHRIPTLVEIAKERFRLTSALYDELQRSKDELAARKSIERAKGLLMERRNLSEREAYNAMRRMAMSQGKTVQAIAETILSISDVLP